MNYVSRGRRVSVNKTSECHYCTCLALLWKTLIGHPCAPALPRRPCPLACCGPLPRLAPRCSPARPLPLLWHHSTRDPRHPRNLGPSLPHWPGTCETTDIGAPRPSPEHPVYGPTSNSINQSSQDRFHPRPCPSSHPPGIRTDSPVVVAALVVRPADGVRLARARLPIRKDRAVVALQGTVHGRGHLLEDVLLATVGAAGEGTDCEDVHHAGEAGMGQEK